MYHILQTHLNLMETLMGLKVEAMIKISKRNGLGDELEAIIKLDNRIYQIIAQMKQILFIIGDEPPE